jgi:hypothetical protein
MHFPFPLFVLSFTYDYWEKMDGFRFWARRRWRSGKLVERPDRRYERDLAILHGDFILARKDTVTQRASVHAFSVTLLQHLPLAVPSHQQTPYEMRILHWAFAAGAQANVRLRLALFIHPVCSPSACERAEAPWLLSCLIGVSASIDRLSESSPQGRG